MVCPSGYYDHGEGQDTIFYTKVLFPLDHKTFSAFEITFPARDKPRFAALVEHCEAKFTGPGHNGDAPSNAPTPCDQRRAVDRQHRALVREP